jgi:hypothetical protein
MATWKTDPNGADHVGWKGARTSEHCAKTQEAKHRSVQPPMQSRTARSYNRRDALRSHPWPELKPSLLKVAIKGKCS